MGGYPCDPRFFASLLKVAGVGPGIWDAGDLERLRGKVGEVLTGEGVKACRGSLN